LSTQPKRYRPIRPLAASLRKRFRITILLAVMVGGATGLVVAGVEAIINSATWGRVATSSSWWIIALPIVGLIASAMLLDRSKERSPDTTEEYIRVFHEPSGRMRLRSLPFRLLASICTIAAGGSMGLEGPSIYLGAAIGDTVEARARPLMNPDDAKILLVAGAAAGIAAIFKAPVTGIVFALEVPYRDDLARRALIPAMFAAASSYVVFVSIVGTHALFTISTTPLRLIDLAGALLVGGACGLGARLFIRVYREATRTMRKLPYAAKPIVGGLVLAGLGAASLAAFHRPFALGPGYQPILHAARGQIEPWLLVALFAMKLVGTSATAGGMGVGGLFFPSVLMGASIGGAVGHLIPGPASLFAVVGIAAFLGGSYKVPLAGVTFVAEATGAPAYIIPGLVAAAVSYLMSGQGSLSGRQRYRRVAEIDAPDMAGAGE
jgi:CIC family chloride channel protein